MDFRSQTDIYARLFLNLIDKHSIDGKITKEGNILTNHTVGEVYCFVRDKNFKNLKKRGGLSNIAPTVLQIMGLDIPKEMDEGLIQ
jgi:bisphosphoglycerate-independent phosphoglycerate mutase (AlkP superfamily)